MTRQQTVMLLLLLAIVIYAMVDPRSASNPEENCLNSLECPLQSHAIPEQNQQFYQQRAQRGADTLLPDGRMDLATMPAPNPSMTVRDLYD